MRTRTKAFVTRSGVSHPVNEKRRSDRSDPRRAGAPSSSRTTTPAGNSPTFARQNLRSAARSSPRPRSRRSDCSLRLRSVADGRSPMPPSTASRYERYWAMRHSPHGRWPAASATASSRKNRGVQVPGSSNPFLRSRNSRAHVIQSEPRWCRTSAPSSSTRHPRLPVNRPRSGTAWRSPKGSMRFRLGDTIDRRV